MVAEGMRKVVPLICDAIASTDPAVAWCLNSSYRISYNVSHIPGEELCRML